MITALRSFNNEELQSIGKRVSVVRIENKKNADFTLTKKTVKTISDDYTALHNSFNKIFANLKNIKALQEAQSKSEITQNAFVPVSGKVIGTSEFTASIGVLGKIFEHLAKQLDKLDLTSDQQQIQEDGQEEIDIDIKKKKKPKTKRTRSRGGRGKAKSRGGRFGAFGKALDITGDALENSFNVVGKSLGIASDAIQTTFNVVGKSFGIVGEGLGVVGKGLKLTGGALATLGGGYLLSKAYDRAKPSQADKNLVSATSNVAATPVRREPTPIGNNSYSSRFADYLRDTFENVSGFVGRTIGNALDATGMLGDFGPGAGSTENAQIAMQFFMSPEGGGWTREQAAGIVGNLQGESSANLNPYAVGDNGNAYGIAQWNQQVSPDRVANFRNVTGTDLRASNLQQQLQFVAWELQNTERAAGNRLRNSRDVQSATIAMSYYERYRGYREELGSAETRRRIGNAQALLVSPPQMSGGQFVNPVPSGRITSVWGDPRDGGTRMHKGIDIAAPEGTPVGAASGGTVTRVGISGNAGGKRVRVDHGKGMFTNYEHLSSYAVNEGDRVVAGQIIGRVGNTGIGTGPHLHFSVWVNNREVNPMPYLTAASPTPPPSNYFTAPRSTSPLLIQPPRRRRGDGSLLMINGQANPFASYQPYFTPKSAPSSGPRSANPNSANLFMAYHGY